MNTPHKKIVQFTDLDVWRKGHSVVLLVYKHTKCFPKEELFGMTSQMRRSAVSVTSNISEGFGRKTLPDKSHFYSIALGSAYELMNQCIIARDLGYIGQSVFMEVSSYLTDIAKMLNRLIASLKEHKS